MKSLGIAGVGSRTMGVLVGLYITGLILLDVRQTQTRVTHFLPGRCHDALNRLLRVMPLSTRSLMRLLIEWAKRQGVGYLSLDDVVVEKAYAKKLAWAGWTYSFAKKRKVYGLHIVVLLWWLRGWAMAHPGGFPVVATQALGGQGRLSHKA
ncbi:MAG: hypothetical protein M3Q29_10775 [Chloroflexota bacterium]|nr:hypothetical protein [Chloroflexota bacterium]